MFYPEESLRRGGRFYLCWVADSWPLRFAALPHRQLWSQDIRNVCDDLIEVMRNESGRPTNRFSLRLSSQLMRGLARLYMRKVNVFLGDLCMLNAQILNKTNKKYAIHETIQTVQQALTVIDIPAVTVEEPENEQRVEEMIMNSGNCVANVQDITLKEAVIPAFQLPPNDGFGEEQPDQLLQQLLGDRTMEVMLVQLDAVGAQAQVSGLELRLDPTEQSHDKSRLSPHDKPRMERFSDFDVTIFRKSTAEEHLPAQCEKEIPEIPPPVLPDSLSEMRALEPKEPEVPEKPPTPELPIPKRSAPRRKSEIVLEELEAQPQSRKRRAKNKLIVDKVTRISGTVMRARLDNPALELRCKTPKEDRFVIRVPWELHLRRCAHAGARLSSYVGAPLTRLYQRNLGPVASPRSDEELERVANEQPRRRHGKSVAVDLIVPEEQQPEVPQGPQVEAPQVEAPQVETPQVEAPQVEAMDGVLNIPPQEPIDISDLPTQKLETLSQAIKRTSDLEISSKKLRSSGYVPAQEKQQMGISASQINVGGKENIPPDFDNQQPARGEQCGDIRDKISDMLQEAGLAVVQSVKPVKEPVTQTQAETNGTSSETPLGSLDRTKVSLGDSVEEITESRRFIREHWGLEGTMRKIVRLLREGGPVDMDRLLEKGPLIAGFKRQIATSCFTSILKLKQHAFVSIEKVPGTQEIKQINLGSRFSDI